MAYVFISEQKYHDKARRHSAPSWLITAHNTIVTGRDTVNQFWSTVPFAELGTPGSAVTLNQDTPVDVGEIEFAGEIKRGDTVAVSWVELGPPNANRGAEYTFPDDTSPEDAARQFALFCGRNVGTRPGRSDRIAELVPTGTATQVQVGVVTYTPAV